MIGLGAAGSAALFHVARSGASVLGIDRFVSPHAYGSTHSESRIIRKAYSEGIQYLPLLNRAYTLWSELENASAIKLVHLGGCLTIGRKDGQMVQSAWESAVAGNIRHQILSSDEVRQHYPGYHLQPGQVALMDFEAGYIQPERCVRTHLRHAAMHGAQCRFGTPVQSCSVRQNHVIVKTDLDTFAASRVILTAGAWMQDFAPVPLMIERVTNSWFQTNGSNFGPELCPPFIMEEDSGLKSYGCPDLGSGIKIGLHHAGQLAAHPGEIDRTIAAEDKIQAHRILKTILPEAAGICRKTTICMYSNTPDQHYLIDRMYGHDKHIIIGSACSGHGFKASSAIGESLAALALDQSPSVDLSPFKWRWPTKI